MAIIRAQIELPRRSGLPADVSVNGLHFSTQTTPASALELDAIRIAIENFYAGVDQILSSAVDTTGTITFYDLADPEPRVPLEEDSFSIVAGVGALPGEVAVVLSFHGTFESGIVNARRRNRIYLGPLNEGTTVMAAGSGEVRPTPVVLTSVADAAQALLDSSDAAVIWTWQTFSPTTAAESTLPAAIDPVVGGWVDNAFDTQRRRGVAATERTTWAATP